MPETNLSNNSIQFCHPPKKGLVFYSFKGHVGFGIKVTVKRKMYFISRRCQGNPKRFVIGQWSHMTIVEPEELADQGLALMAKGIIPVFKVKAKTEEPQVSFLAFWEYTNT